jgi:CheY-like chemotaxis protein
MLIAVNHKVDLAESGQQAIAKLQRSQFDLVFTDLAMPEMDGWETARVIRNNFPDVRIVMVTGYGPSTTPPVGEENLIDGIIGKPFDFTQVGEMLTTLTTNQTEVPAV